MTAAQPEMHFKTPDMDCAKDVTALKSVVGPAAGNEGFTRPLTTVTWSPCRTLPGSSGKRSNWAGNRA
jgi:hypothetical protein